MTHSGDASPRVSAASGTLTAAVMERLPGGERERERYRTLLATLTQWRDLFAGRRALDFGASWGTSMIALYEIGAREVAGVEPEEKRVAEGQKLIAAVAPGTPLSLTHVADTGSLPFASGEFEFVLANAVFEHIPQPRARFLREVWRVLTPGGHLMINETPNKYYPKEMHTTDLWFNQCLPSEMAYRRAIRRGRFDPTRSDWSSSGWRGMGYYEMVAPLQGYKLVPETTKPRQRMLTRLGLPASMLDPYPTWILRKQPAAPGR